MNFKHYCLSEYNLATYFPTTSNSKFIFVPILKFLKFVITRINFFDLLTKTLEVIVEKIKN